MRGLPPKVVWWNANIAVWICVLDCAWELLTVLMNWSRISDLYGGFPDRLLGRLFLVGFSALVIWYYALLTRAAGGRTTAAVFGAGYLLICGVFDLLVVVLAQSVYHRPVYAIQWSAVYLGASLVAYAVSGRDRAETLLARALELEEQGELEEALGLVSQILAEAPGEETSLARAVELKEQGELEEALGLVSQILAEDPGNPAAEELKNELFELLRGG